jgi:hypothetical protein
MQNPRYNLDAVVVPDLYDRGVDDLAKVIGEHLQLSLDQRFHVLDDVGEVAGRCRRIEPQVFLAVILKLPPTTLAVNSSGSTVGSSRSSAMAVRIMFRPFLLEPRRREARANRHTSFTHFRSFAKNFSCTFPRNSDTAFSTACRATADGLVKTRLHTGGPRGEPMKKARCRLILPRA